MGAWIGGYRRIPAERANYSAPGLLFGFDVGVLDDLREPLVFRLPELPEIRRRLAQDDRHAPILEALYYIRLLIVFCEMSKSLSTTGRGVPFGP